MSRRILLLLTASAVLFALVTFDLSADLQILAVGLRYAFLAIGLAILLLLTREPAGSLRAASSVIAAGAIAALGIHFASPWERAVRDEASWEEERDREAHRVASAATRGFADLSKRVKLVTSGLASEATLVDALRFTDPAAQSEAFALLGRAPLPRVEGGGSPGVTLFDASLRPVAWAGENHPLPRPLAVPLRGSGPALRTLRRSAETSLLAVQRLGGEEGVVAVEVPITADRRLENRYLEDHDAISTWAGRSVDSRFFSSDLEKEEARERFERLGDPHWGGTPGTPRLLFGLRTTEGEILGVGSLPAESPDAAFLEGRRRISLALSVVLVLSSGLALLILLRDRTPPLLSVAAIWGFRVVLRASHLPLGLGLGLDNPADYASSLFFGFARSPIDFLLTMIAVLLSVRMVGPASLSSVSRGRSVWRADLLGAPIALVLFLGVEQVVLDAWRNSNLALAQISFPTFDPPRVAVQLGLVALFFSAAWLSYWILAKGGSSGSHRRIALLLAADASFVLALYLALSTRGFGDHVLLAAIPLLVLHLAALERRRLSRPPSLEGRSGVAALVLLAAAIALFYPATAWFESVTIRSFIESIVTPIVLQHRSSPESVLVQTAVTIDAMYDEGGLGDFRREDLAFSLWVATDLSASSLSSSVEVVDPARRIVSRFAQSFPPVRISDEREPAPEEWIKEDGRHPTNPDHPGFTTARRTLSSLGQGDWEIRIRVAADWRNLPFIATTDPYLRLFRAAAIDSPPRFPHQELELIVMTHGGRPIFQSVGGTLQPGEDLIARSLDSPLWWEHPHEGQIHRTYLFGDDDYLYALSYPEKSALAYGAELALWLLLAAGAAAFAIALSMAARLLGRGTGPHPQDLLAGLRSSFSAKLYAAFVLVALVPIASLAFFIHRIVTFDLERGVEREALERAEVAARLVQDIHSSGPASALGTAPVTDLDLEHVARLSGVDVDLYIGGELLATSNPELVASGLLPTRAAPTAQREIVVERRSHSLHRESIGTFPYLVVSVPIVLEPWTEPGILSIPLASRQPEIDRKAASLNQTVLLLAVGFSAAAALLAYSLARRIAGPINQLTHATQSVAKGRLEVSLEPGSRDEIGELFSSFNRMTEDLKRQRADLEKSKKLEAWAEMARQVAHEVKNPLTPIQLSAEHLRRVYGDPEVDFEKVLRECTDTILEQVKTLRQISMEFSTFASPGPLELEPTDVTSLVRETVSPYLKSPPSGVNVRLEAEPGVPRAVADRRLLRRTLVNLVENALHAVNGKGRIDVRVSGTERNGSRYVEVRVRDDGIGIDPEVKGRVFEPYFSTRAAGTGLGLAIAKKVVEDHGGTIGLESEPGRGTEVTIRLPATS